MLKVQVAEATALVQKKVRFELSGSVAVTARSSAWLITMYCGGIESIRGGERETATPTVWVAMPRRLLAVKVKVLVFPASAGGGV